MLSENWRSYLQVSGDNGDHFNKGFVIIQLL